jgi:hypothetical protein
VFGWACGGGGSGTLPCTSPNARRRFVDFGAAGCKDAGIGLFACCANSLLVAASFSCSFCARFSSRSRAFVSRSFFLTSATRCRSAFAFSACCFLYNLDASASSFVCFFWSFYSSSSRSCTSLRARAAQISTEPQNTALLRNSLRCCRSRRLLFFECFRLVVTASFKS